MLADVTHLLPIEMRKILEKLPSLMKQQLEEIRIRENRPLEITLQGTFHYVSESGELVQDSLQAFKPHTELCRKLLEKITNYSLYTMEEELRRGYITVAGGHRIGLAGRTILDGGIVRGIRDIGGFNLRIAREVVGASKQLLPKLYHPTRGLQSTLIISPPQQGKTTLIRDIARSLSYGELSTLNKSSYARMPLKVGIVDERSEIAASVKGIPSFDVGPRTDVMDACPKAEGMMMMLRSMSPEVMIADEIGRAEDADAIREAAHSGVKVIATAHAYDAADVRRRPEIMRLIEEQAFELIVELQRKEKGFMHRIISVDSLLQKQQEKAKSMKMWVGGG